MTSSRAGHAMASVLFRSRSLRETCSSVSIIPGKRDGAEEAERSEGRAPVDRLWPIPHFDQVRAWLHNDAAQKSIRLVNRGALAIHCRLPTREKGIRSEER